MNRVLQTLLTASLLAGPVLAIPQNFGGGFFGAVGKPFEDFAIAALRPGAELKGEWQAVPKEKDKLRLAMEAVVFGIPASEIIVENPDRVVTKFTVIYRAADDRKRGKATAPLKDRVISGVRAYTGSPMASGQPAEYQNARFSVVEAKGDVTLEITKLP
jgi:hypothetical protein